MKSDFEGFKVPKGEGGEEGEDPWTKIPHRLVKHLHRFKTKAELAVVIYIFRHTWGFKEWHKAKRLTLDDFENGRQKNDGTRMDGGVGMSRAAIITGLRYAEKHGFIRIEVDDSDAARVVKRYAVRMADCPQGRG